MNTWTIYKPEFLNTVSELSRFTVGGNRATCIVSPYASIVADQALATTESSPINLLFSKSNSLSSFDPLDIVKQLPAVQIEVALQSIFSCLFVQQEHHFDALEDTNTYESIYHRAAISLLCAVAGYQITVSTGRSSITELIDRFFTDDIVYQLAGLLDTRKKEISPNNYSIITSFLQLTDKERSIVLSRIQDAFYGFNCQVAQRAIDKTSFDLEQFLDGHSLMFIEIPLQYKTTLCPVARLWIASLVQLFSVHSERENAPLLVVDSPLSVELFPVLSDAVRLEKNQIEVWSFWESLSQIENRYPISSTSFLAAHDRGIALGPQSPIVALELENSFKVSASGLAELEQGEQKALWGNSQSSVGQKGISHPRSDSDKNHVVTFASAHDSHKWDSVCDRIRTQKNHPVIVVETSGYCYEQTASARAHDNGQVIKLDPFKILGGESDQFNPLDVALHDSNLTDMRKSLVLDLVNLIVPKEHASIEPFWRSGAVDLISGVISYLHCSGKELVSFGAALGLLSNSDFISEIKSNFKNILTEEQIASSWLEFDFSKWGDVTCDSFVAVSRQALFAFTNSEIDSFSSNSSFRLKDFGKSAPVTIYIEWPDFRSDSQDLIGCMLLSLLSLMGKIESGVKPILVVDSPYAVRNLEILIDVQRSPQFDLWTFFDSELHLRRRWPSGYTEFMANCDLTVNLR